MEDRLKMAIRTANAGRLESAHFNANRSFWLGLSSFIFLFLTGIPAIAYGIQAHRTDGIKRLGGNFRRTANFGIIFGGIGCLATIVLAAPILFHPG